MQAANEEGISENSLLRKTKEKKKRSKKKTKEKALNDRAVLRRGQASFTTGPVTRSSACVRPQHTVSFWLGQWEGEKWGQP